MSDHTTELDLVVGSMFTTRPEEDRELYEDEREWLSDIQDLLREEGIEVDLLSRPGVEIWEGGIDRFMDLYQLRQLAAYLEQGRDVGGVLTASTPDDGEPDPVLVAIWDGEETTRFPHLINHQADGGYYLPVDFAEPIWLEADEEVSEDDEEAEDPYISFGSAVGLQRELTELSSLLQQANVPSNSGPARCLQVLRTAAEQSVANDLPIIVW
ncbi:hypothetical protein SE17_04005 [Kouleothrix aurantiaca]|jgi:hypothetical protein|uniref:Uncharacterized protein n=1 Tax=Kouleothrix aurantiaca TaxID=186479 RepID=A0A0P9D5P7_9CHLR|nr:hypothetical protein SE17_04005 [Kouleothrix aurantiaca]